MVIPNFACAWPAFVVQNRMSFGDNQQAERNFFHLLAAGMSFLFKHLNLNEVHQSTVQDTKMRNYRIALLLFWESS